MSLKTVQRLAARIAGVGESRIKIVDEKRAREALTADDVRGLLHEGGVLKVLHEKGVGRSKARLKQKRLHEGRRRGVGSRKGSKALGKTKWVARVRALRKLLKASKTSALGSHNYRRVYLMIKGGFFSNKRHLRTYLKKV